MKGSFFSGSLNNSFDNVSRLFRKYTKEGLEIESDIAYYANAQFHRAGSGIRTEDFSLKLHCLRVFISNFRKIKVRLFAKRIYNKKLIFWMDNYQFEEYDDAPLKRSAINNGYKLVEPNFNLSSLFYSISNLVLLLFRIEGSLRRFSSDYCKESGFDSLNEEDIFYCLKSKYFLNQLIKARCFSYPFLKKNLSLMDKNQKAFIIYRSNGDITPFLIKKLLGKSESYSSKKKCINQVLYAHASLPVSVPLTMIASCVDLVLTKNSIAEKILRERADCFDVKVKTVGDPRSLLYEQEKTRQPKLVTLALTEHKDGSLSENHNKLDLNFIRSFLEYKDNSLKVDIKRRYNNKKELINDETELLVKESQRNLNIIDSVKETRLAFVLGNSKLRMISSVFMDYYQVGVPTAIVIPDDEFLDIKIKWKVGFDFSEITIIKMSEALNLISSEKELSHFFDKVKINPGKNLNPLLDFFVELEKLK